jgi:hypothetical protein
MRGNLTGETAASTSPKPHNDLGNPQRIWLLCPAASKAQISV